MATKREFDRMIGEFLADHSLGMSIEEIVNIQDLSEFTLAIQDYMQVRLLIPLIDDPSDARSRMVALLARLADTIASAGFWQVLLDLNVQELNDCIEYLYAINAVSARAGLRRAVRILEQASEMQPNAARLDLILDDHCQEQFDQLNRERSDAVTEIQACLRKYVRDHLEEFRK